MNGLLLPIAQIASATEAEGPGKRFAIWLQGCPLRCPGCCNPQMLPFLGGEPTLVDELFERMKTARRELGVEGLSLLGGEPFAHAEGLAALAEISQAANYSVMVFSGYTLDQIESLPGDGPKRLLEHTDILVDGPYVSELPEPTRRWVGSSNQVVHFLTDRYRANDPIWKLPNTLEIRLVGGELSVNGFPAKSAVGLWRQVKV
jgi:anaerobic ribonucleoside-triphosphate reductase activating protein